MSSLLALLLKIINPSSQIGKPFTQPPATPTEERREIQRVGSREGRRGSRERQDRAQSSLSCCVPLSPPSRLVLHAKLVPSSSTLPERREEGDVMQAKAKRKGTPPCLHRD